MNRAQRILSWFAALVGVAALASVPLTGGVPLAVVVTAGAVVPFVGVVLLVAGRRPPVFALAIVTLLGWVVARSLIPVEEAPSGFYDVPRSCVDLAVALVLVVVVIRLVADIRGGVPSHVLVDGVNAILGGGLLAWVTLVAPVLAEPPTAAGPTSLGPALVAAARLPVGVLLLTSAAALISAGLHRSRAAWILVTGFGVATAATVVTGLDAAGRIEPVDLDAVATMWLVVVVFVTAALVNPALTDVARPTASSTRIVVRMRFAVVVGCSIVPILVVVAIPDAGPVDRVVRVAGTLAIAGVGAWRVLSAIRMSDRAEGELLLRDHHDGLTGLPNRRRLARALDDEFSLVGAPGRRPAVALVSLDRFKNINDTLGHTASNEVLRMLAQRLRAFAASAGLLAARVAGDEFAVLQPATDPDAAEACARALRGLLAEPVQVGGHRVFVTASIGVAVAPSDQRVDADELLKRADIAVLRAKSEGRDRVATFDQSMEIRLASRMDIEHALHGAVESDELRLVHQPIVDVVTGTVNGFEALMRWHRPDGVVIRPDDFVPVAEEIGLIDDLGAWALNRALTDLQGWIASGIAAPTTTMSVNVSPRQMADPHFVDIVREAAERSGAPAHGLWLEVTESMMLADPERVRATLRHLHSMNVRIALDDFGTGYSSLSLLQRFPLQRLKVDRGFVHGVAAAGNDRSLVRTVVAMGASMGLDVVAEGVETAEQLAALRAMGCPKAQGYLLGRPIPADMVPAMLASTSDRRRTTMR